jgi:PrcB C-terminal
MNEERRRPRIYTGVVSIVWLFALLQAAAAQPPTTPFATVARGHHSGIEERREAVVRTESEWKALWKAHAAEQPAPAVDLAKSIVAGVFLGTRSTGGYAVEVTAVERQGADVIVRYRETKPDPNMMVTQVLTSPFHIVSFEKTTGEVKFQKAN